jgi:hypothetical protein
MNFVSFCLWLAAKNERFPRLWKTALATALALAVLGWLAIDQLGIIYKKSILVAVAAVLGYYIDRAAFPYARPHDFKDGSIFAACMLRRAIIMAAVTLAMALGA